MSEVFSSDSNLACVRCLALAHGGAMVCEIVAGDKEQIGKKAFVTGLVPGETADVLINEDRGSFVHAELVAIRERSAERIEPPCPVFGRCGGCDLQYLPIAAQRELKRSMFESTLQRQGKLSLPHAVEIFGSDLPAYNYRRRISLHISRTGEIGFFRESSGEVVSFSRCLIASERLNELLTAVVPVAREIAEPIGGVALEEFAGTAVPVFQLRDQLGEGELDELMLSLERTFETGKIYFRGRMQRQWYRDLSPSAAAEFSTLSHFSQINEAGNKVLVDRVTAAFARQKEISEFYAGAGNFTLALGRAGKLIDAIEVDPKLTALGNELAQKESLSNVSFINSSVERFIDNSWHMLRSAVLLDPPRSGARALCEQLSADQVEQIVYVSCALPTLARDLALLVKNGFSISSVGVVDMFAQTHHIESVTVLER